MSETFPDAQDVGEQAQGPAWVLGALMFEEEVEERIAFLQSDAEEQVAFGAGELGSMKEPGSREREFQSRAPASSGGRWF